MNFYQRLSPVFHQAQKDNRAIRMDGKGYDAITYKSVKIVRDVSTKAIAIYNTKGLFGKEISQEQYNIFIDRGWSEGVKAIQIHNLNAEAVRLRVLIQQETYTKALHNRLKKVKDELRKIISGQH